MSIITDTLNKAGYTLQSTSSDILPAVLLAKDQPVGFLMPDLSVSLVQGQEQLQDGLQNALAFAIDNQGLQQLEPDEYILTQYGNTLLATAYDYDEQKQNYTIFSIANDGRSIINSYSDKALATQEFAAYSGLLGDGKTVRTAERTTSFIDKIKHVGYAVRDAHDEKNRAYEILDNSDKVVGYIGHDNRLTLTTDNQKHRNVLTNTYQSTHSAKIELPGFFERLKSILHDIGLALRVTFAPQGQRYTINDSRKEIAVVADDHKVTYTPLATAEQMKRIDALVSEIERETHPVEKAQSKEQQQERPVKITVEPVQDAPMSPAINNDAIIEAIASSTALLESIIQQFNLQVKETAIEQPVADHQLSPKEQSIANEFSQYIETLETLDGFNQEKYDELSAKVTARFGTTDPQVFSEKLVNGDYSKNSLADRLSASSAKSEQTHSSRSDKAEIEIAK